MSKIVVPIDFSETSTNALRYAIDLFKSPSLEIIVLHAYGVQSTSALLMKNIDRVLEKDAKQKMEDLIETIKVEFPSIEIRPLFSKNSAVSTIVALGDSGDYDFIVMGTKGASGLKEVFMGSVAGGVISRTRAPVIVVPDGYGFHKLDEIVFAVSHQPVYTKEVMAPIRKIGELNQSKIKILHIMKGKAPQLTEILDFFEDLNPSVEYAFGSGDTHEDLNNYLMKDYSGLLCLVRENKGFFERLLDGSVTLKQTFNSLVPLLIIQD